MKNFSPASITALKEALINIYWKKQDLKNFVKLSIENDAIVNTINWEFNRKFESVNELVDRMVARKDLYNDDLISLIYDVSNITDFSHLKIWDDSDIKIPNLVLISIAIGIRTRYSSISKQPSF